MPKAHIFFSHSSADGTPQRLPVTTLAAALRAADYDVLLDRDRLQAGTDWGSVIDGWIRGCDAAVIFITEESIKSDYCRYEWANLSSRWRMQKQFLILPIYIGKEPNDIKGRADRISEISGYKGFRAIEDIIPDVTRRVATEIDPDNATRLQVNLIAATLRGAMKDEEIRAVARNNGIELGCWDPNADRPLCFASKFMELGLVPSLGALGDVQEFFKKNPEEFGDIVELIARCAWVSVGATQRIRASALHDPARPPLGLNTHDQQTAECYLLAGSDRALRKRWPFGVAFHVFGNAETHLHARVRSGLIAALKIEREDPSDAEIRAELDYRRRKREPVFVLVKADGLDEGWVDRLRVVPLFADVNFLILTGPEGTPNLLEEDDVLKPLLQPGFEQQVWSDYAKASRDLNLVKQAE